MLSSALCNDTYLLLAKMFRVKGNCCSVFACARTRGACSNLACMIAVSRMRVHFSNAHIMPRRLQLAAVRHVGL